MSEVQISEHIARISDILEQIERLNRMNAFHKHESREDSMRRQYEEIRQGFLEELIGLLSEFQIEVEIKGEAA